MNSVVDQSANAFSQQQHQQQNHLHVIDYSDESADETTTTDQSDESDQDAEQNEQFLQEYFHQQFLKMQAIYPPTFKSKVIGLDDRKISITQDDEELVEEQPSLPPKRRSLSILNKARKSLHGNFQSKNIDSTTVPTTKGAFFPRHKDKTMPSSTTKRHNRRHSELSALILDSLEKLGIVCFDRRAAAQENSSH